MCYRIHPLTRVRLEFALHCVSFAVDAWSHNCRSPRSQRRLTILKISWVRNGKWNTHMAAYELYHRSSVLQNRQSMEPRGKVWWGSREHDKTRPMLGARRPAGRPSRFIDPLSWEYTACSETLSVSFTNASSYVSGPEVSQSGNFRIRRSYLRTATNIFDSYSSQPQLRQFFYVCEVVQVTKMAVY